MIPKIDILYEDKCEIGLRISNCRVSIINAIRRILLSDIPCMAFDQICFEKNTGTMNEDMLAHRISMIPLYCPNIDNMKFPEDCNCMSGCQQCEIIYALDINNNHNSIRQVYCSDLKNSIHENIHQLEEDDDSLKGILLTRLDKNQELKLMAKAIKGVGRTHKKWSSVNVCTFERKDDSNSPTVHFHLEVNPNVNCIDVIKKAIEILELQIKLFSKKVHTYIYEKDEQYGCSYYKVPYDDTILNILIEYMIENYDIPICFYQRGHFLNDIESKLVIMDDRKDLSVEETNEMIRITMNMIQTNMQFLENSLNHLKWGIQI